MLDAPTEAAPRPTRLADYRPPEYLIETADLTFDLDGADTRVAAHLTVHRNPAADGGPLRLDGEELVLESIALDGRVLSPDAYRIEPDGTLLIADPPERFGLDIVGD